MRVTVLCGGPSSEREVSLVSGNAVAAGLREAGHQVYIGDISPSDLRSLDVPADVVFPVLHGDFGESGELQLILETRGLKFVGSGSEASALGMDKAAAKRRFAEAGCATPAFALVNRDHPTTNVGLPCVAKAIRSGSSIDVFICHESSHLDDALRQLFERHEQVLIEQFIDGPELTVGILHDAPLPPIRITANKGKFFDYASKYTSGGADHRFDTGLPESLLETIQAKALAAHRAIGCRHLSRVDVMLAADNTPYLLEINTMPGFTPVSLLPEAAGKAGVSFTKLVDGLVGAALSNV